MVTSIVIVLPFPFICCLLLDFLRKRQETRANVTVCGGSILKQLHKHMFLVCFSV